MSSTPVAWYWRVQENESARQGLRIIFVCLVACVCLSVFSGEKGMGRAWLLLAFLNQVWFSGCCLFASATAEWSISQVV